MPGIAPYRSASGISPVPCLQGVDTEIFQHVISRGKVSVLHVRHENRQRVACVGNVELEALRRDSFRNVMENLRTEAARSRKTGPLNAHYTAVSRRIGREKADKAKQIVHRSRLVSCRSFRYLGGSRLAGNLERWRAGFLSETLAHNMFQYGGDFTQRLFLADALLYHFGRELLYYLSVLHHGLNEPRTHHCAAVGDGVIERKCRYWRHLGFVTYAHPGQRRLAPINVLAALVLLRHADAGRRIADYWQLQVLADADAVKPLDKLFGVLSVVFVDYPAYSDVGAVLQRLRQSKHLIASAVPVVVAHLGSVHVPDAASGVNCVCCVNHTVVQRHHE